MLEMYIIFATDAYANIYKFTRFIRNDDTFGEQLNKFEDDVRARLGNGCHIDVMIKQDAIKFEGTTYEYDRRFVNDN